MSTQMIMLLKAVSNIDLSNHHCLLHYFWIKKSTLKFDHEPFKESYIKTKPTPEFTFLNGVKANI